MSFLKKHWPFTVPAAVILCMLLVGVVALYSTSEPPELKRVYVMPERSDNPIVANTGGIPLQTSSNVNISTASNTETTSIDESTAISEVLGSDADAFETCCPEEDALLASGDDTKLTAEQVEINRRVRKNWEEWKRVHDEHNERLYAHVDGVSHRSSRLQTAVMKLYRLFNPSARAELRRRAEESVDSPKDRALIRKFLDEAETLPATTPEEVTSEFEALDAEIKASQTKTRDLIEEYNQLKAMPTH